MGNAAYRAAMRESSVLSAGADEGSGWVPGAALSNVQKKVAKTAELALRNTEEIMVNSLRCIGNPTHLCFAGRTENSVRHRTSVKWMFSSLSDFAREMPCVAQADGCKSRRAANDSSIGKGRNAADAVQTLNPQGPDGLLA